MLLGRDYFGNISPKVTFKLSQQLQNIFEKEKANLADAARGLTKYSRGT